MLIRQKDDEFIFPVADGTAKLAGRDYDFREPTLRQDSTVRSEDLSVELQCESGESHPANTTDDSEVRTDFWSILGDFIHRHNNEPGVQLYVPMEETFPNALKYIDVSRSSHTDLDVMQEKRIDDYWNVDSSKHLSDSWRGFTKFTFLKVKPPKGYMWSGVRLTKIQTTTRPDHVWPEVWTKMGDTAQNREKQEWAKERAKLDNARKLIGIYLLNQMKENIQKLSRTQEEHWKDLWYQPCRARGWFILVSRKWWQSQRLEMTRDPKQCMVEKWNLMNPRDSEQNLCSPKFTKIE